MRQAIAYADPDERVGIADIMHQVDWYKAQGMVKGDFDSDIVIDRRYVMLKPGN